MLTCQFMWRCGRAIAQALRRNRVWGCGGAIAFGDVGVRSLFGRCWDAIAFWGCLRLGMCGMSDRFLWV
ncbi:hypothetical protein VB711_13205 [Cronbergia sp. UHCC 0137]|uniref:hypothetical protein n=1 Tax=Cronbergia sp. UHCC 0137 TaxID=3110239 RepID=UPI002B213B07|nr:hypothetical protein [Cronbergia sp. UHCC 0137]MEA5618789.1 hypothetical protein [Cronbergia sp. UHCC 0137]